MNIESVIGDILVAEGSEYTNDPADSGGPTKYGVTLETLSRWRGTSASTDDVRTLGEAEARNIYRELYYRQPRLNLLGEVSPLIAAEVLDTGVNIGTARAVRMLQRMLNVLNDGGKLYPDISVDGLCGPATAAALLSFINLRGLAGEKALFLALNSLQCAYYVELAERREKDERFMFGWLVNRVSAQVFSL